MDEAYDAHEAKTKVRTRLHNWIGVIIGVDLDLVGTPLATRPGCTMRITGDYQKEIVLRGYGRVTFGDNGYIDLHIPLDEIAVFEQ